jgi:hypothetical protein
VAFEQYDFTSIFRYNGAALITEKCSIKALSYADAKEIVRLRTMQEFGHLDAELMAFRFVGKFEINK